MSEDASKTITNGIANEEDFFVLATDGDLDRDEMVPIYGQTLKVKANKLVLTITGTDKLDRKTIQLLAAAEIRRRFASLARDWQKKRMSFWRDIAAKGYHEIGIETVLASLRTEQAATRPKKASEDAVLANALKSLLDLAKMDPAKAAELLVKMTEMKDAKA